MRYGVLVAGAVVSALLSACTLFADLDVPVDVAPPSEASADTAVSDAGSEDVATIPDVRVDGVAGPCPQTGRGPAMVLAEGHDGGLYCIDSTEVSQGQYEVYRQDPIGAHTEAPPFCVPNTSKAPMLPSDHCPETPAEPNRPMCTDFCDAVGFCQWAGKRLCGKLGGGRAPLLPGELRKTEWADACSHGGRREYPYGAPHDSAACTGTGASSTVAVGSKVSCQGGYPGLLDMSGNADEWEYACDDVDGGAVACSFRGGRKESTPEQLACGYLQQESFERSHGIRCCADAL